MNKKIIKWCLIGLGSANLLLLMTGVVIPWIISNDKLPVAAIVFLTTTIVCAITSIICCIVYTQAKKYVKE